MQLKAWRRYEDFSPQVHAVGELHHVAAFRLCSKECDRRIWKGQPSRGELENSGAEIVPLSKSSRQDRKLPASVTPDRADDVRQIRDVPGCR
jgi:hypothetical protein